MFFPLLNTDDSDQLVTPQQNGPAYSWVNTASIIVLLATISGMCCTFGAYFTSLMNEFDWSYTTTSALFSLHLLLAGIFSFAGIRASKILGTKRGVFTIGAIGGFGLFLSSFVEEGWQLFLTFGIIFAMSAGAIGAIVISITAGLFNRRSGISIGIVSVGAGLGIIVMFPIDTWLVSEYGWQDTFLIGGIISWCLIMPASLFLKETTTETTDKSESEFSSREPNVELCSEDQLPSTQETTDTRNSFLFFGILFAYSFSLYMVLCHFVPRLESMGFNSFDAGATLGLMGGAIIFSRLMIGFSVDPLKSRSATTIFILLHATALFWLIDSDAMWMFYLFAVVIGATLGGIDLPIVSILGNDMSRWKTGNQSLFVVLGWFLGAATGPVFAGLVIDNTGSYEFAFFCGGMSMVLAAICIWGMKPHQRHVLESKEVNQ